MVDYNYKWWHNAIIYEIYPKSFKDGNRDGIGDIQGIISKLDYLKELGIDALWICPVFISPFRDSGYDVAGYYGINPDFGTMGDMEKLIELAHQKNIRIILDMVINHTSDRHPWFISACESEESCYRDYYIFRKAKGQSLPNNWVSSKTFKPVWTYNKPTDDYYLHIYTKYQPDLNWENKALKTEIYTILKFWLEKGIDGFRLDVINKIAKAKGLPDYVKESNQPYADHLFENQNKVHRYIKALRKNIFIKGKEQVLIGQTSGINKKQANDYTHESRKELDLYLQFEHVDSDRGGEGKRQKFIVSHFKSLIFKWQEIAREGVWPTVFMGSHDLARMVSHYGNTTKAYHMKSAKMLVVLQLCLRGTQIIYMGDELALKNVEYNAIHDFEDIRSHSIYETRIRNGEDKEAILKDLRFIARDNARYNIPWEKVDEMVHDKESILNFYKEMIHYRQSEEVLLYGDCIPIYDDVEGLFAYERRDSKCVITILANMIGSVIELDMSNLGDKVQIGNDKNGLKNSLSAYEVRLYRMEL